MAKKQPTLAQLQAQIDVLNRQAEVLRQKEKGEVVARIKEAIATYEISASDLFATKRKPRVDAGGRVGKKKPAAKKTNSSAAYRDGSNQWSGRGPRPKWLRELLAAGRSLDEFRVAK